MPAQTVIDSLEFARTGQQLGGTLPIAGLTRLADSVFDAGGEIRYELTGLRDARLRPALALVVSGVLRLRCQRCLGELDYRLEIRNVLLLGTEEEAGRLDEEGADWIEVNPQLDVAALVEDEIILSLPYSPRHEGYECRHGAPEAVEAAQSAFAKLAALKRSDR